MSDDLTSTDLPYDFGYEDADDDDGQPASLPDLVPGLLDDAAALRHLIARVPVGGALGGTNYLDAFRDLLKSAGDTLPEEEEQPQEDEDPGEEKSTETRPDGTIVTTYENNSTFEQRKDGSSISRNKDGRIVSIRTATGDVMSFGYDKDGKINSFRTADGIWTSDDGKTWKHSNLMLGQSHPDWKGTLNLSKEGVLERTDEKQETIHSLRLDGTWTLKDKNNRILQELSGDGTNTRNAYSEAGTLTSKLEQKRDGLITVTDSNGKLTEVYPINGSFRQIERSPEGKVTGIQMSNGTRWESTDGKTFKHPNGETITGQPELTTDGSVQFKQSDGKILRLNRDDSRELLQGSKLLEKTNADGTRIVFDESGRVQRTVAPNGQIRVFGYTGNRLTSVQDPDGTIRWASSDGKAWTKAGTREAVNEERSVSADGIYTSVRADKSSLSVRPDGSSVSKDASSRVMSVTDKLGRTTTFGYDTAGKLNNVKYPDGKELSTTDGKTWKNKETEQTVEIELSVSINGTLTEKSEHPEKTVVRELDGSRQVTDRNGTRRLEPRNDGSTVITDPAGRVTQVLNGDGTAKYYRYNSGGRVVEVSEGIAKDLNDRENITWTKTLTTADGTTWKSHDGKEEWRGQVFVGRDGSEQRKAQDGTVTRAASDGAIVSTNKDGLVTFVRCTGGREIHAEYTDGKLTKFKNGNSEWTTTDGGKTWKSGNETFEGGIRLLADGTIETTTNDRVYQYRPNHGQVVSDKSGKVLQRLLIGETPVEYSYETNGRIKEQTETLADRTRVTKDGSGNIVRVSLPNGEWRQFERGADGRVVAIRESNGTAFTSVDGRSFRLQGTDNVFTGRLEISPSGAYNFHTVDGTRLERGLDGAIRVFDGDGKLRSLTSADRRHVAYDETGRVTETIDPNGNHRKYAYKENLLVSITEPNGAVFSSVDGKAWKQVGGPRSAESERNGTYALDKEGNLTFTRADNRRFVHGNNGSSIEFAASGLPACIKYPDGSVRNVDYNDKGEATRVRHPNGDTWNRISEREWQKAGTNEKWQGTLVFNRDGSYKETAAGSEREYRADGSIEVRDRDGHRIEKKNNDGSWTIRNDKDQITATWDAAGKWRRFEYDANGRMVKTTDAQGTWSTTDGTTWSHDKLGKREQLSFNLTQDGVLRMESPDGKAITRNTDGSSIETDKSGKILKQIAANGKERTFEYDRDGRLNKVVQPDNSVLVTSDGGKTWTKQGDESGSKYSVEMIGAGGFAVTNTQTGERIESFSTGRVLTTDRSKRAAVDVKPDGSYTKWTYGEGRVPQSTERGLADGTILWANDKGQIVKTKTRDVVREFAYDDKGKLNYVKGPDGTEWRCRDGQRWFRSGSNVAWIGELGVTPDGDFICNDKEKGESSLYKRDGSVLVQTTEPQTARFYNVEGRVVETRDFAGKLKQYGYDSTGKLNRFVEYEGNPPAAKVWTSTDGENWTSGNQKMKVRLSVDSVGTLSRSDSATGRAIVERLKEAPIRINPETTGATAEAIRKALYPGQRVIDAVDNPTGNRYVDTAIDVLAWTNPLFYVQREAVRSTTKVYQNLAKDWQYIENALKNLSEPEREALKADYKRRFGVELEAELNTFKSEAECEKTLNALKRKDGEPDYAGNIHAAITELNQSFFGRSRTNCEKDIRDTISRLSSNQIAKLEEEYRRRYGVSLEQALLRGDLSSFSKEALKIQLKGTDEIRKNPDLTLELADLAIKNRSVELFEEAFRSASPAARAKFKEQNGEQRLKNAFEGHWYNALLLAHPLLQLTANALDVNTNITDTDLRHVMDYAQYGKLSTATQVRDNTSWLGDNEKAIESSLHNMSEEERKHYMIGQALVRGDEDKDIVRRFPDFDKMPDADKQKARDFYNTLHNALDRAAGIWFSRQSQQAEMAKWEDMISQKGGGIISKIADHVGMIYNSGDQKVIHDIEKISKADWEALHKLPAAERAEKLAALEQLITSFKGAAFAERCMGLLREKLAATSYEDAQKVGRRTVLQTLTDNDHWYGNNKEYVYEAIENMPAAERAKYYDANDTTYRDQLNRELEKFLGKGATLDSALAMLARGSKDKAPVMDPLDKLNLRILQNDEQRRYVNAGQAALTGPGGTVSLLTGDRSVQMAGQASGLLTNYPADAVRDLAELFKKDPESYRTFKAKYDSDSEYRGKFLAAARSLYPLQLQFDRYIKPLIEKGELKPEILAGLRVGILSDDDAGFMKDFAGMSAADRNALLQDENRLNVAFSALSGREREVATNLLRQGKANPEDLARACVIGFGTRKEEVIQAWKDLKPEEREAAKLAYARKYGSDISLDLRGKIGADEAEDILDRQGSPEERLDRILQRYYRSYDGIGKYFVDTFWDGTGHQSRDMTNQLVAMQAEYSSVFERMKDTPEFKEKMEALVKALKDFKESKEQMADAVVDALIAVAAVGGAFFTGGASLSLLAVTAIAGAALKVAVKAGIMGADYNWNSAQPLIDALTGAFDAATSFIGPGEIAALCRMGEQAAAKTAKAAITQVGKAVLRDGAEKAIEKELAAMMRNALATGSKHLDEKALEALAMRAVKEGDAAAVKALTQALKTNLESTLKTEMQSVLKNLAREYLLIMSSGALGGGVSGTVRGMAEWDPNLSVSDNLQRVATTGAMSAGIGAGAAGAFTTVFKVGGAAWRTGRGLFKAAPHGEGGAVHVHPEGGHGPGHGPGEGGHAPAEGAAVRPAEGVRPHPDAHPLQPGDAKLPRPAEVHGPVQAEAVRPTNDFANGHQMKERIPDGFTNAGAGTEVHPSGKFDAPRAAVVVDRKADQVLRNTVNEARQHLEELTRQRGPLTPQQKMEALTEFVRSKFPKSGSGGQDANRLFADMYATFMAENAGKRVPLGEFIKGGMGGCSEQALLLKVLADDLGVHGVTLVRGNGTGTGASINHVWATLDQGGGKPALVFDPRQNTIGRPYSDMPGRYTPGADMSTPRLKPDHTATAGEAGGWRVVRETPDGKVVVQHDGARVLSREQASALVELNPQIREQGLKVGQEYRIRKPDGTVEGGWKVQGISESGEVVLVKQNAVEMTVPKSQLRRLNPELSAHTPTAEETALLLKNAKNLDELNDAALHALSHPDDPKVKAALQERLERELKDPAGKISAHDLAGIMDDFNIKPNAEMQAALKKRVISEIGNSPELFHPDKLHQLNQALEKLGLKSDKEVGEALVKRFANEIEHNAALFHGDNLDTMRSLMMQMKLHEQHVVREALERRIAAEFANNPDLFRGGNFDSLRGLLKEANLEQSTVVKNALRDRVAHEMRTGDLADVLSTGRMKDLCKQLGLNNEPVIKDALWNRVRTELGDNPGSKTELLGRLKNAAEQFDEPRAFNQVRYYEMFDTVSDFEWIVKLNDKSLGDLNQIGRLKGQTRMGMSPHHFEDTFLRPFGFRGKEVGRGKHNQGIFGPAGQLTVDGIPIGYAIRHGGNEPDSVKAAYQREFLKALETAILRGDHK